MSEEELEILTEEIPKKRGRGRPPGSLNRKGSKTRGFVTDTEAEGIPSGEPDAPGVDTSPGDESDAEVAPVASKVPDAPSSEDALGSPPRRKPRAKPKATSSRTAPPVVRAKPRAKASAKAPAPEPPEPQDYLEFLRRTLEIQKARHRSEKIDRYDNYFRAM